jgi:hypothetical protein
VNGGRVTLRNLIVRDLNGPGFAIAGIRVASGTIGSVRIENCEVYGVDIGIALDAGLTTIVNTSIHDTGDFGVAVAIGELAADALSVSNTSTAVSAEEGAHVTISNSTLTENNIAIRAFGTAATATVVDVARTTIASTKGTGVQIGANGGTVAEVFLHSTTVHANIGFNFLGVGGTEKIFSYGDNRLVFYAASTQGGSLTPISGI